jgi:glutathione S-transferase
MISRFDIVSSTLSSSLRAWAGINSQPAANKPAELLQLYDIEGCPFCRLVREALTELDLDAQIFPCPKNGERFRAEVVERGGKAQFPFLVDPNTGMEMYESMDIISYLYETYGGRSLPLKWRFGGVQKLNSALASTPRAHRGIQAKSSRAPLQLLELYSFEASPFARPVRELLCELEISYILRSCGRSRLDEWVPPPLRERLGIVPRSELKNRRALQQLAGKVAIPFLLDPNTDTALFESGDIIEYLETEYLEG